MKKLRWYQYAVLVMGGFGVLFGPMLLTRPYLKNWDFFDFSKTGSIGDTIGGITSPFVGLLSILLLWWTLSAQLKFNQEQDKINKAQRKFNDASRILTMQTQIMQLDENICFGYSTKDCILEGRGSSCLRNLQKCTPANVKILYEVLISLIDKVHMLDVSVASLVNVANDSALSEDEKKATMSIALVYIEDLLSFYEMVSAHEIEYVFPTSGGKTELNVHEKIKARTDVYAKNLRVIKEKCNSLIDE